MIFAGHSRSLMSCYPTIKARSNINKYVVLNYVVLFKAVGTGAAGKARASPVFGIILIFPH